MGASPQSSLTGGGEGLVARGEQQVACMQREGERLLPAPVTAELRDALEEYAGDGPTK